MRRRFPPARTRQLPADGNGSAAARGRGGQVPFITRWSVVSPLKRTREKEVSCEPAERGGQEQGAPVMSSVPPNPTSSHGTNGVPGNQETGTKSRRVSVCDSLAGDLLVSFPPFFLACPNRDESAPDNSTFCCGRAGIWASQAPQLGKARSDRLRGRRGKGRVPSPGPFFMQETASPRGRASPCPRRGH